MAPKVIYSPGHSYLHFLRCMLCDYVMTYELKGPGRERKMYCPNDHTLLVHSLK